jgi:23S rRNA (guanosine2251-2'-O)-methyltransferase
MKPEDKKTSKGPMKFGSFSRPMASSSKTSPTAPAAGNADQPELLYGLHAVREALRAGTRPLQRLLVLRTDRQFADLVQQARSQHIPVHLEPPAAFDRLVPDQRHQGIIAFVAAKAYCSTDEILDHARRLEEPPFLVILDGVEDPHNLGAVLRTAEAAGVHGIFIPERRAAGLTPVVAKVSAGALDHMRVARVVNLSRLIQELKRDGVWVYGVEPSAPAHVTTIDMTGPVAFVFGGEGGGIRHGVLQECDGRVRIPMKGKVESLNVSAAVAVTLFEGVRQRNAAPRAQRPSEPE